MKALFTAFVAGLVFAVGLGASGMTRPDKVIGFLDVTGAWDPSLALVMAGAIAVHLAPARLALSRPAPWFDARFHLAPFTRVDARLLVGSVIFGVGWGLAGYCPGPAVVAAGAGLGQAGLFALAMLGGMGAHALVERARAPAPAPARQPG